MTIPDLESKATDGRKARSERTRTAIAEAMLSCFEDGMLRPQAKEVAKRAGVSMRAVFRHFDNMEALVEAICEIQIERVSGQLPPIVTEGSLRQRIDALVLYWARGSELIAPARRAALLAEPFSEGIRKRHAWLRATVRRQVRSVFAPELGALSGAERRERIAALRALLSFSYWEELRRHEGLSSAAAMRVVRGSVQALLQPRNDHQRGFAGRRKS